MEPNSSARNNGFLGELSISCVSVCVFEPEREGREKLEEEEEEVPAALGGPDSPALLDNCTCF